jgi:hypothetical protein
MLTQGFITARSPISPGREALIFDDRRPTTEPQNYYLDMQRTRNDTDS